MKRQLGIRILSFGNHCNTTVTILSPTSVTTTSVKTLSTTSVTNITIEKIIWSPKDRVRVFGSQSGWPTQIIYFRGFINIVVVKKWAFPPWYAKNWSNSSRRRNISKAYSPLRNGSSFISVFSKGNFKRGRELQAIIGEIGLVSGFLKCCGCWCDLGPG